jgi:hypothetical protein
MYYALPKVSDSMPLKDRLYRWTQLIAFHPLLQKFNAEQFLQDQGPEFCSRLTQARPIVTRLMEEYKASDHFGSLLNGGMADDVRTQVKRDCDLAICNFFGGLWGQIKLFEWTLLHNAVQMSGPEDFTGEESLAIKAAFEGIGMVLNVTSELTKGHQRALEFQIEDVL